MNRQGHSDQIVAVLQSSSEKLIRERWLEFWSFYCPGKPLKISLCHTITPDATGAYKLKTSVSFSVRIGYSVEQETDCNSLNGDSAKINRSLPPSRQPASAVG